MPKVHRQVIKGGKHPPFPKQPIPNQESKNGNGNDKRILLRAPNFEAYEKVVKRLAAFDRSAPTPVENTTAEEYRLHTWNRAGICEDCRCTYSGLYRVDPCPGKPAPPSQEETP